MGQHEWILLTIILLAGTFGGIVSYYGLSGNGKPRPEKNSKSRRPHPGDNDEASAEPVEETVKEPVDSSLIAPILRGIAAAFIVPLFLNSVSSDLLKKTGANPSLDKPDITTVNRTVPSTAADTAITSTAPGNTPDGEFLQYLLFAATCLLASISSRAFIDSVSKRVLNLAEEAREEARKADAKATAAIDTSSQTRAAIREDLPMVLARTSAGMPTGGRSMTNPPSSTFSTFGKKSSGAASYDADYNDDPNKNKFGGKPSKDGWTLSAEVRPIGTSNLFFEILLRVTVDNPNRIKSSTITFHLHPTFLEWVRDIPVTGTTTELKLIATGAFTVGVDVNGGEPKLELDLAELPDAPKEFKER